MSQEKRKGQVFVVSAPAGTGKTTLVERLTEENPRIVRQVTTTTRLPRSGEKEGIDYFFISRDEFVQRIQRGEWLEYVELYENFYGTWRPGIERTIADGKDAVLVIDTNGARNIKKSGLPAVYIMILPPSMEVLRERLLKRGTETEQKVEERLAWAREELKRVKEYEYTIVNDDLERAYQELRTIFIAEHHRQEGEQ